MSGRTTTSPTMSPEYAAWLAEDKRLLREAEEKRQPLGRPACLQRDKVSGLYRGDTVHTLHKQARKARYEASLLSERRNRERIEEAKAKVEKARNQPKAKRPRIGTHRGPQRAGVSSRGGDTT